MSFADKHFFFNNHKQQSVMKKVLFTLATLALLAGVSSCTKEKEGKYNPKEKIESVYAEAQIYVDDLLDSQMPKFKSEEWVWEKERLTRISYYGQAFYYPTDDPEEAQMERELMYTQLFTYDEDGRLTKSEILGDVNMLATCEYEGKYLKKMTVTEEDEMVVTYEFTHVGKRISSFKLTISGVDFDMDKKVREQLERTNPLRFVLAPEPAKMVTIATKKGVERAIKSGSKANVVLEFQVSWNDADNVSDMMCNYMGGIVDYSFRYDTKNNPFYNLFDIVNGIGSEYVPFMPLNKNNVTGIAETVVEPGETDPEVRVIEFSFTYNSKDYPTSRKMVEGDEEFRYEETLYYEYK